MTKLYDCSTMLSHPLTLKSLGTAIKCAEDALARDNLQDVSVRLDIRADLSGTPWQLYVQGKKKRGGKRA